VFFKQFELSPRDDSPGLDVLPAAGAIVEAEASGAVPVGKVRQLGFHLRGYAHTMRTRPYHRNDLAACLAIFDSNLPTYFALAERPDFETFLRDLAQEHAYQVIELDGGIVACGGLSPPANGTAGFCWGMVEKSRHRQGLGRQLAQVRLRQAATDPRVERVQLNTSQHTEDFYAALGFRVTQRVVDGHGPGLHAVHMEARLR